MRRILWILFAGGLMCAVFPAMGIAQNLVFQTRQSKLEIAANGTAVSLKDTSGNDHLAPSGAPFFYVKKSGKYISGTQISQNGDLYRVTFGNSGIHADFGITGKPDYLVIELAALDGQGVQEVRIAQMSVSMSRSGAFLPVRWDDQFSLVLMGLTQKVDTEISGQGTYAAVYPDFGMVGQRVAVIAVPTAQFLNVVKTVEHDFQLPSPSINGVWAKQSPDVKSSYLFADVTEANADQMIRYAKMAGMKYILFYEETWAATEGSYPLNPAAYPHGESGLKAVVEKLHAAGLKAGLHIMCSLISKNDPMVRPVPSPGLLTDAETTLAKPLGSTEKELASDSAPAATLGSPMAAGGDWLIENEIVHCAQVRDASFTGCTRGANGTGPSSHPAGAPIKHLVEQINRYLADLRGPLSDRIAVRIANLVNNDQFDMIYFDAGELNKADGPYWYWVGVQQAKIYAAAHRDLLMQGSGATSWTWHMFARGTCEDMAAVAVKEYLDEEKIAVALRAYQDAFVPAELGWTGLLKQTEDHPGTTPDEMENYFVRMLALDLPESIQTNLDALQGNGRTEEMLSLMGKYEQLRLSSAVPPAVRAKLTTGEWHMTRQGEFHPIRYDEADALVSDPKSFANTFGDQPLKFRLQVAPSPTSPGSAGTIELLHAPDGQDVPPPGAQDSLPGALAVRSVARKELASPMLVARDSPEAATRTNDLSAHKALAVTLDVQGGGGDSVLDVQLQDIGGEFRDYYIPLNFRGRQTVTIQRPDPRQMLANYRPAKANYGFKLALYTFNFQHVTGVNLRWARYDPASPVRCRIFSVEALQEQPQSLTNATVSVGNRSLVIPGTLNTGDYAEYWGDGQMHIFNQGGVLLRTTAVTGTPTVASGNNSVRFSGANRANLRFTLITMGD